MADENKKEKKIFLLNNDSKRVIKINGVRLMIGLNRVNEEQLTKLKASPYFKPYFDSENYTDRLKWVDGFGPQDHRSKEIADLSANQAAPIIKEIYDLEFLEQLEIDCKDSKMMKLIVAQKKEVLPTEKELK